MPRPREFDEAVAVDRAMDAFWSTGYETTSTEQLCAATGLGRSSIYNTFGSKHALFRKALRRYQEVVAAERSALLDGSAPLRDKLGALFQSVIDDETGEHPRGCLIVNTAVELGRRDPAVRVELERDYSRQVALLESAIGAARAAGEVGRGVDAHALAVFLHGTVGSLRLLARGGASRAELSAVAQAALSVV